jgi:hypothetical protein
MLKHFTTKYASFIALLLISGVLTAQTDSSMLRKIYDEALVNGHAYENLRSLCKDIGHRLSGSESAERSVEWSENLMKSYGFDRVWLDPITVPHWERDREEKVLLLPDSTPLATLALGFSMPTNGPITAPVVMFNTIDAIKNTSDGSLSGKIAFLNQPMNPRYIDTFKAYEGCAGARVYGASEAAKKGAVAFLVRSVGLRSDDFPHTGVLHYDPTTDSIPALALSTNDAYKLSQEIARSGDVDLMIQSESRRHPDAPSHNVIAEIKGSEFPDQIIVFGGHLDSWDVGEGAHDDGAGVVQALEVLRIFKALDIQPRYTLRCVFFMNEENGTRGAKSYAKISAREGTTHYAAMESDRGGFAPRGFTVDAEPMYVERMAEWLDLFKPYLIHFIEPGYGGVDINPLKKEGTPLIGFVPDSQRYFDLHHTANDVFENVNKRELELGAASMASLIYLIDTHGFPEKFKN